MNEEQTSNEEEIAGPSKAKKQKTEKMKWKKTETFTPAKIHGPSKNQESTESDTQYQEAIPIDLFSKYFDDKLYEDMATFTNMRAVERKGKSLKVTPEEMKIFIGICISMGTLGYPRIRMYWQNNTAVPVIQNSMTRDRFFSIRNMLKVIDDNQVTDEEKKDDRIWKIRPLINKIKATCKELSSDPDEPKAAAVDEQMIPFSGA